MVDLTDQIGSFSTDGFLVVADVFSSDELQALVALLDSADKSNNNYRRTSDLFAIRQFLKELPAFAGILFNDNFRALVNRFAGPGFFVVRSIYFDKPELSNWLVPWHQDITISVDGKQDLEGFHGWTQKAGQFSVCPPEAYLQNIVTLRIHLDDTDASNGALKVIPESHLQGIRQIDGSAPVLQNAVDVSVLMGGVMLMKPLLLHASGKSISSNRRRVIHIEFSNLMLPGTLNWSEKMVVTSLQDGHF